jgi:hypothetical protein
VPIVLLLLASSFSSFAQFGAHTYSYRSYGSLGEVGKRMWQRSTYGYFVRFSNLNFTAHYKDGISGAPSLYRHVDTTITKKVKSDLDGSWGAYGETFIPIAHIDEESIFAFHYGVYCEFFKFKVGDMTMVPGEDPVTGDLTGFAGGLNLGFDYRIGGDALLDKHTRTMFNIGAGISPGMYGSDYAPIPGGENGGFTVQPYLKAEAGFFLGIAFKVRADLLLGKGKYFNASGEDGDTRLDVTATSPIRGIRLGLAIMPYSWDWDGDY